MTPWGTVQAAEALSIDREAVTSTSGSRRKLLPSFVVRISINFRPEGAAWHDNLLAMKMVVEQHLKRGSANVTFEVAKGFAKRIIAATSQRPDGHL